MNKMLKLLLALLLACSMVACATEPKDDTTKGPLTAGTYTAVTTGMKGELAVEVTVDDKAIVDVKVTDHKETYGIGYASSMTPVEVVPAQIVEHQTLNVDNVSGATITSAAIKTAVKDCLTQAGATEEMFATEAPHLNATEAEYTVDIVVVGGGVAGLMAANTAADEGKSVLLVEKKGILGGSTVQSGGNIIGVATTEQAERNIEDTPEALYEFLMSYDEGNQLNPELVKDYAYGIAEDLDYMAENGVEFIDVISAHPYTLTPNRLHLVGTSSVITDGIGGYLIVPLTKSFADKGGKLLLETKAEKLLTDEAGKVVGLEATNKAGETVKVNAGAVILTTGGYAQNKDMVAKWAAFNPYMNTASGSTGDGLVMAEAVGAQIFDSNGLQLQYVNFTTGETGSTASGLVVDITGKRLTNENQYQSSVAEAFKRANSYANYYITATKDGVCAEPYGTVQYGITVDSTPKAATLEELAGLIGVDAATLVATVERYNELCAKGEDADFGKPAEFMIPVEGDTYYAMAQYPVAAATFGGLVVDVNGHVLNEANEPISGLYAAGEVALTGQFAEIYPTCGLAIGNSAHMGRNAGYAAAND